MLTPVMTMSELCEYLRIHSSTAHRLIKRGMPAFRVGSDFRFRKDLIDSWMEELTEMEKRNNHGS